MPSAPPPEPSAEPAVVPGLIGAFAFDGRGGARVLDARAAAAPPSGEGEEESWRWLHLDRNAPGAADWLRGPQGPPARAAEALLAEDTRPRSASFGEGRLVILRGVNLNPDQQVQDMVSVRLWAEPGRIVTVTLRRLFALGELREAAGAGRGPRSPGAFVAALAEGLTDRIEPVLDGLEARLAELEDAALVDPAPGAEGPDPAAMSDDLAALRRVAIPLRRYIAPQRDALAELRRAGPWLLEAGDQEDLGETADRLTRQVEDLDALRERAAALSDQIASDADARMNRAMYLLSVVSALFLPLGFLTGLLGVNLAGIPGDEGPWGFAVFVALLVLVAGLELWLIRRLRLI